MVRRTDTDRIELLLRQHLLVIDVFRRALAVLAGDVGRRLIATIFVHVADGN